MQEWRPIPGYEGHYEASSEGSIRCVKQNRERTLTPVVNRDGLVIYNLSLEGAQHSFTAARLVCMAWYGPASGRRIERIIPDITNDRADNVRWAGRL